ncbi:transcriptional family [Novosphingobium sp. Rr 2-17]|nr:transcriptional family [Novosphingobium sp. Rr 2-17]
MVVPLEVTTLIGRLSARATNEAQSSVISDLGANEVDILAALASRGAPFRAKPSEVAGWSGVTGAAITARVDRLEARGLVERIIDSEDRRIRWISLTSAGIDLLRSQALALTERPLFADIQKLTKKESAALCAILRKLV